MKVRNPRLAWVADILFIFFSRLDLKPSTLLTFITTLSLTSLTVLDKENLTTATISVTSINPTDLTYLNNLRTLFLPAPGVITSGTLP
jgi:hypothetical protein